MKSITIFLIVSLAAITFCASAQNKRLLLINSEKVDTVTFVTGDHIVIHTIVFGAGIKGRLNEINDSSLLVGNKLVSLRNIKYMRKKNSREMATIKTIGASVTALGLLSTFIIAASHPTRHEDPRLNQQYEDEMEDYRNALYISGALTVAAATTLLIRNPKYYFNKGWSPYVYLPVEDPIVDTTKTFTNEPRIKDSVFPGSLQQYEFK